MPSIDNSEDLIDSRDVNARIEELEDEIADLMEKPFGGQSAVHADLKSELDTLRKLASDGSDYSQEWDHGATLIRDTYFKRYAQELADDIGAIPRDLSWPCTCIDWDQAVRELQMDYATVEFDGVTYWIR